MENEETENLGESQTSQEIVAPAERKVEDENPLSELDMPVWSVISFEKRIEKNLKYADAAALLEKLVGEKISGLCIITDEAAEKMSGE
jgi:hypothetical protein